MVKILEQYTTKLDPNEHQKMQEAVKWLYENGFLAKANKYEVTKYALQTLINIVANKKRKIEEDAKLAKDFEKNPKISADEKQGVSSIKENQTNLSSGGQDA